MCVCLCVLFWFFGFATCGILVPHQGFNPHLAAFEARYLNHWTTRDVPKIYSAEKPRLFLSHFHLKNSLTDSHGEMSMSG